MKVKITKEAGLKVGDSIVPKGDVIELTGPLLDAALRFKEAEPVKDEKAPEEKKK